MDPVALQIKDGRDIEGAEDNEQHPREPYPQQLVEVDAEARQKKLGHEHERHSEQQVEKNTKPGHPFVPSHQALICVHYLLSSFMEPDASCGDPFRRFSCTRSKRPSVRTRAACHTRGRHYDCRESRYHT